MSKLPKEVRIIQKTALSGVYGKFSVALGATRPSEKTTKQGKAGTKPASKFAPTS